MLPLADRLLAFLTVAWPSIANAIKGAFLAFAVNRATVQATELKNTQEAADDALRADKVERSVAAADADGLDRLWLRINADRNRTAN